MVAALDCGAFDRAAGLLPARLAATLLDLPDSVRARAQEIRLRSGGAIALTVGGETRFVGRRGCTTRVSPGEELLDDETLQACFLALCNRSVYAHESELRQGYLRLPGGCRAGVCGTLSESGAVRDVTSINLRIARSVPGCADGLLRRYTGGGLLIAGPPGSGKTTLLREFARRLADGFDGVCRRVALVDTRGELSAGEAGGNADVLIGYEKPTGIERALRTLNPEVIVFDEIGSTAEVAAVSDCLHAGAAVVTTAHAATLDDLTARPPVRRLLRTGAIDQIALLTPPAGTAAALLERAQVRALCG